MKFSKDDRYFKIALLVSLALHAGYVVSSAQFNPGQKDSKDKAKQLEITHWQVKEQKIEVTPVKNSLNISAEEADLRQVLPTRTCKKYYSDIIKNKTEKTRLEKKQSPREVKKEEKITEFKDLSPKEIPIFIDYYHTIREKIRRMIVYPYVAKKEFIEGTAYLSFTLGHNGELKQVDIEDSSGYQTLDRSASWAVKRASPFSPFPNGLQQAFLRFNIQISYKLN